MEPMVTHRQAPALVRRMEMMNLQILPSRPLIRKANTMKTQ